MDSDLSQPLVSTPVDTRMHKEDQQATGGPNIFRGLEMTARANLSAVGDVDCFSRFHKEAEPDYLILLNLYLAIWYWMKEPNNTSFDHISAITDHMSLLTQPNLFSKEETSSTIKLEDLAKLVSNVLPSFKDLDSPEDDPVIIVNDSDKDEKMEKDEHKLELEKNKAEAEATLLKAQPSFTNVEHLNELLVKSLQTEFSKNLSAHDFSSSLSTELKDLPSKFNELTEEV
ncbi:hypothetical protein Tco_0614852 [Tanacetum coccineum]